MSNIYVFADESGDLGYNLVGGSLYFGFGTATLTDRNHQTLWNSFSLRCALEQKGVELRSGFHAQQDTYKTKSSVFLLINKENPRFDFTFLNKSKVERNIKEQGDLHLYKIAWLTHFKRVAQEVAGPKDQIFAISASIKTKAKTRLIREALNDVVRQIPHRNIVPIYWDANTSWGLQMADYAMWSAHRHVINLNNIWWKDFIEPNVYTFVTPWDEK